MADQIHFTDGAGYERYMGLWSQLVGRAFLPWLAAPTGWRWLDVGCGNGAFTEMIVDGCAPASVSGIDPSDAQLAFARSRPRTGFAAFHQGSATALPFDDHAFDAAVMPLVIVFVPDPAKGVGIDVMRDLWTSAGLVDVTTHEVTVERTFANFEDYLATIRVSASMGRLLAAMSSADVARLEARLRDLLPADANGRITYSARANCVKGRTALR